MMRKVIILNHSLWYIRKEENLKINWEVNINEKKVSSKDIDFSFDFDNNDKGTSKKERL